MIRTFILRTQHSDKEVARKAYMSWNQATRGFEKAARDHLGDHPQFIFQKDQLFGGYYRNARGDVLEMR